VFKSVAVLSGGERSRLALLLLLLEPANLLILDEPTNHLDLASKDVLLRALRDFPGTVVFVSHDRHFIANLATSVLELRDGHARYLPGDYEYYLAKSARDAADAVASAAPASLPPASTASRLAAADSRAEDKRLKSELRTLEKEEALLLQRLEELENERLQIEESMALPEIYADGERMKELRRRHGENERDHHEAMRRWEQVDGSARLARERLGARNAPRIE